MSIHFKCSSCGSGFKAADESAGQSVPCPKCGSTIQVPVAQATLAPPSDPLDETESASFGETSVDPLAGIAKKVAESKGHAPPPPPPIPSSTPAESTRNAFQSPSAPLQSSRELDLTHVKITGIDLKFGTVFKLVFQMWIAGLALAAVVWIVLAVLLLALRVGFTTYNP